MSKFFITLTTILLLNPFYHVAKANEIDYLLLTENLLRDKNYSRANTALKKAKSQKAKNQWDEIEEQHYYLLNGLYLLRTKKINEAIVELKKVLEKDFREKKQIYLAEAYLSLKKDKEALEHIQKVNLKKVGLSVKHLKAKILFENNRFQSSLNLLHSLLSLKAQSTLRLTIHYLLDLELSKKAMEIYRKFRDPARIETQSQLIAKMFKAKGHLSKATLILEEAALYFPQSVEILSFMSFLYDKQKQFYVAGDIYTRLAYIDHTLSHGVVEYLKKSGRKIQAQILNMSVSHQKKQLIQKLSIYIDNEDYGLAHSLEIPLHQVGAFDNDDVKYAFAYVQLTQGKYDASARQLKSIKKSNLINRSLKLLDIVKGCKKSRWECYGHF